MNSEKQLPKNIMIVSETDAKGNITYANNDFCKIAGFTKEELIGQPHNILRHSDMPKAAFKQLWESVQNGKTWNGIVKNRCKDNDYYWVNATVYPVQKAEGKRYISVRVKTTQDEVQNAIKLYKQLKQEEK
ncbi:PAS sensor domain-containing protein [Malaciobacter halophilus]|uniref:PAS sensor domain-containing protein n=1 Tax=Malaciobacter halophilus TaxID=197482 RepID=A0A2N1J3L9_9BACT|nr:PAS domain-containing protein [Malaciobacter halophilus]AXH09060.1 PAS sensor-containing signal transduction protein [Malaciobacter halophilus]PKI81143.1 PAS sensor domain-containing protein [Malaciobacter halophilus]